MAKLIGLFFFSADTFFDRVAEIVSRLHERKRKRKNDAYIDWLKSMDPDEVAKSGRLEDLILAKQIRVAKRG